MNIYFEELAQPAFVYIIKKIAEYPFIKEEISIEDIVKTSSLVKGDLVNLNLNIGKGYYVGFCSNSDNAIISFTPEGEENSCDFIIDRCDYKNIIFD